MLVMAMVNFNAAISTDYGVSGSMLYNLEKPIGIAKPNDAGT